MSKRREFVARQDETHMCLDGFDAAILGVTEGYTNPGGHEVVVYSIPRILAKLEKQMSVPDAWDYFNHNILGSYIGERTPLFVWEYGKDCG
jgi:hypothetical protein